MQWNGSTTITDSYNYVKTQDQYHNQIDRKTGRVLPEIDKMAIGEAREFQLAVLFIDVNGYKDITRGLSNKKILRFLNSYLSEMTQLVRDYDGVVEKYMGDGITAVFGFDKTPETTVRNALHCALTMLTVIKYAINPFFSEISLPNFTCSVGIDFGDIWLARTGVHSFSQFSLVGIEVNTASQLVELAQKNDILLGGEFYEYLSVEEKGHCIQMTHSSWNWTWRNKQPYPFYRYNAYWKNYPLS